MTPHEGDIVQTPDGQKWRVTSVHPQPPAPPRVIGVAHVTTHIEMATTPDAVTVIERHPGGAL